MTVKSMTGFGRDGGQVDLGDEVFADWTWEIKSVNAKGLDIRFRLPHGYEDMETTARRVLDQNLGRGAVNVQLSVAINTGPAAMAVNEAMLSHILDLQARYEATGRVFPSPPRLDTLLGLRGMLEMAERDISDDQRQNIITAMQDSLCRALEQLEAARADEGQRLETVLQSQLVEMKALTDAAHARAASQPETLKSRLVEQLALLMDATPPISEDRLAQELALLATKADVREEIDRLLAHIAAGRDLLDAAEPVGRRLDFLCQELNREANTLCSKAVDLELTRIGMELKSRIEQFREQIQNVE